MTNSKRLEATHFIEVYRTNSGKVRNTKVQTIDMLKRCLTLTVNNELKTVCVWKIKFHPQPQPKFKSGSYIQSIDRLQRDGFGEDTDIYSILIKEERDKL